MPGLRDEITNTFRRLRRSQASLRSLDETVVSTDARIGRHYGNYRILGRLGAGGMGHVYLATDTRLNRQAALKFLSPKLKSDPNMLTRLQEEARTASGLNHPNILTIYDIAEADGEPFIASEFVDGRTLRQELEAGTMDCALALDIAMQVASALMPAHEAGVIHRDLKPGNVMLRPDGLVKVIDFGLAKLSAHGQIAPSYESLSDPDAIAGTVQYMSPEQARGDTVDHRTDLWSLGVMLYEMVSRRKPFDGETESHVIVAILDHKPPSLKEGDGITSGLTRVVEKALSKSLDKRYQSAQELFSALKSLDPLSRPSRVFPSTLIRKRNRARTWKRALALLGVVAAAFACWWWPFHGRDTVLGPRWFVPGHYAQVTHRGDVKLASLSPDGKRIAYATAVNGQDQLHLLNLATNAEKAWPPFNGNTLGVTFSPDSSTIYYTVHDEREWGRLYSLSEQTGEPTSVLDDVDGPITFSPNGSEFAFHRRFDDKRTNREAIVVVDTHDTGTQQILLNKYNTSVGTRIAWAPSGIMAVNLLRQDLRGQASPTVLLFTRDGKELRQQTDARLRHLSGPAWIDDGSLSVFVGAGRGDDESQGSFVELATRTGQFQFFSSPMLSANSVSVAADFQHAAALTSRKESSLFVAKAQALDVFQHWPVQDSFDSLTWNSNDSLVHPTTLNGSIALAETKSDAPLRILPHYKDCAVRQASAVPGTPLLVFASNCDANANASNLWILNEADGQFTRLTEHSYSDQKPAASSDGDTILYNTWPNNTPALMKLSLRTKAKSPFTSLNARNASISPDGQHVACQIRENYDGKWRAAILSMRGGTIEKDNLPLPTQLSSVMHWSPDGTAVDYVDALELTNIWRLPLSGVPARPLTRLHGRKAITDFGWSPDGTQLAWVTTDVQRDVIIFENGETK